VGDVLDRGPSQWPWSEDQVVIDDQRPQAADVVGGGVDEHDGVLAGAQSLVGIPIRMLVNHDGVLERRGAVGRRSLA
jgi:hypothetical protein